MSIAGVWERTQPVRIADVKALALSPEDLLLHLCVHTAYHGYAWGLKPLCDVAAVLAHYGDRIDWEVLLRHVEDSGIDPGACWALPLARRMLAADVPARALTRLGLSDLDPPFLRTLEGYILAAAPAPGEGGDQGRWDVLCSLAQARGLRERALIVLRSVFCPVEQIRYDHNLPPGSARAYAYYLLRPFVLARRWGRDVLAWAFRTRRATRRLDRARAGSTDRRAMAQARPTGPEPPAGGDGAGRVGADRGST
jgi:hypothetical protein